MLYPILLHILVCENITDFPIKDNQVKSAFNGNIHCEAFLYFHGVTYLWDIIEDRTYSDI